MSIEIDCTLPFNKIMASLAKSVCVMNGLFLCVKKGLILLSLNDCLRHLLKTSLANVNRARKGEHFV